MDLKNKAYLYLVFTLISGAIIPVLLAEAHAINLYEFFMFTFALSIPTSYMLMKSSGKASELSRVLTKRKTLLLMVFTGLITYFPIEYSIAIAERYVSASLATAIFRTSPLLMLLLLPIMLREKLSKYQIVALCLAFAGLYIGISNGNLTGILQNGNLDIVAFLIAMAFAYALSVVMIKKYLFDLSTLLFVSSITMFVLSAVLFVYSGAQFYAFNLAQIIIIAYIGIFFNVFSFYMYFYSLRPLKATVVSNVYFLSPFITFILAGIFLGEQIQFYYVAIAGLAGAGILIQSFDKQGSSYISKSKTKIMDSMTIFDVTGVFANTGEVALTNAIQDGGRVLAIKIPDKYEDDVSEVAQARKDSNIYTNSYTPIEKEAKFVKGILGATEGELIVMKAGLIEECEEFFEALHKRIKSQ